MVFGFFTGYRKGVGATPIPYRNLPANFTLLQITPRLGSGGVERATLDLAAAVARSGHGSLVASCGGPLETLLAKSGARLIRLPVHSRNPLTMAANAMRLKNAIRRETVSLAHVRSRAPAFSTLWAARAAGIPVVTTYHGIYGAKSRLKRWYNAVMTRGEAVIANSAFTRDHIVAEHRIDPARIAVIPEGVDTDAFDPAAVNPERVRVVRAAWGLRSDDRRAVILLAARFTPGKGHRLMIEAFAATASGDRAVLILAGDGHGAKAFVAALKADIARAGLADRVRFVGPCDDMPAAFAAADLVVAPSTVPESFGRSVVEAQAMERPVLASPLGGPAETVAPGETGWLAASGDTGAWAAALQHALGAGPETLAAMGRAGRARVQRLYGLTVMCEATFALYARLLEEGR